MNVPLLLVILWSELSQAVFQEHYTGNFSEVPKKQVCMTPVCRKKANEIKKTLDTKLDPCDDFYEFVCSGWKKEHPLPKDAANYGVFRMLDDQLNAELKTMLGKHVLTGKKRHTVEDKARIAYQSCISNDNPGEKDIRFLRTLMAAEGLKRWPLVMKSTPTKSPRKWTSPSSTTVKATRPTESQTVLTDTESTRLTWESTPLTTKSAYPEGNGSKMCPRNSPNERKVMYPDYRFILLETGMHGLFQFNVIRDPENLSSHIIRLDQLSFPLLGRNELVDPEHKRNRETVGAYKTMISTALAIMKPHLQKTKIIALTEQIFSFERELAKRSVSQADKRDQLQSGNRTTIKALQSAFPELPLLDHLNKEFRRVNITLTENEVVCIFAMPYYASTSKLLSTTHAYTIYNYIGWRRILHWASYASKTFRDAEQAFRNTAFGYIMETPLWMNCVKLLRTQMWEVVGRLYVTREFTPHAKHNVQALVRSIRTTLRKRLKSVAWMDERTRQRALHKLREMRANIGYPRWMLNATYVEMLYENLGKLHPRDPFVKVYYEISEHDRGRSLLDLRRTFRRSQKWALGPATINAYYDPEANNIIFPSGILQDVFYRDGLPESVNLGSIGFIIGHEFVHGFDDYGSQYDALGSLRQWWSNVTRQHFMNKTRCFVDQYNSIVDKDANMSLNGKNTVGENIADNAAVRLAFQTYEAMLKRSRVRDVGLQGLEKYSGKQLFFISYALIWCANSRAKFLEQQIQYNPHSPPKYRVNVPLRNFPPFSTAFNCKATSQMNPGRNTCVLW